MKYMMDTDDVANKIQAFTFVTIAVKVRLLVAIPLVALPTVFPIALPAAFRLPPNFAP